MGSALKLIPQSIGTPVSASALDRRLDSRPASVRKAVSNAAMVATPMTGTMRGSQLVMRGQVETMQASFVGLGVGLAMAIVLALVVPAFWRLDMPEK